MIQYDDAMSAGKGGREGRKEGRKEGRREGGREVLNQKTPVNNDSLSTLKNIKLKAMNCPPRCH